jgi:hypothetical protein
MSENKPLIEVQDKKIILSILWVFVVFNIAFADIIGFIEPGTLEKIINEDTGFDLTPALILIFSLFQAIPMVMIVAARLFRRDVNRWLNMVASVLTLFYIVGGGNWGSTSYPVFALLEVAAIVVIFWLSLHWKE